MNVAILTAGGTGSRMNNKVPKQFITVNEIPIIIYTLEQFQNNKNVDKIIVACLKDWQPMLKAYKQEFNISKLEYIADGGATGLESIRNCVDMISGNLNKDDNLLIHDGNRPLIDDETINNSIKVCNKYGSAVTYIDINDGILAVDNDNNITDYNLSRENVKATQTPHAFKYSTISEIYNKIDDYSKYISVADAAGKMGYPLKLVYGSELNFKITTRGDLVIFKAIIDSRSGNV
jgi:2-C-methyl-D-erythritol 4-phosphate cytidylyltransferase